MKYEFNKIDDDTTELKYKDNTFIIKRTVGLLQKLQSINYKSKIAMLKALKEEGMTPNDLVVVKVEGGKTYEDRTSADALEEYFRGIESQKIYDEICLEYTHKTYAELLVDIGIDINNAEEIKNFTLKLSTSVVSDNKSPR